jgi:DNA adenine methylase
MMATTNGMKAHVPMTIPEIERARPFVKMAGGKTKLLPELLKRLPKKFNAYHEPFVGGGALFWELRAIFGLASSRRFRISDINTDLISAYREVRDNPSELIRRLRGMKNNERFYYRVRAINLDELPVNTPGIESARAARMIYLNKTCFNGLHRVNRRGQFNVPFGRYANPAICDAENLLVCSRLLRNVEITSRPFFDTLDLAQPGDLVYCDPPYLPISETSNFTSYDSNGFGWSDHVRLHDFARQLKAKGVHVMISNSASPRIRDLYRKGFRVDEVQAPRSINATGSKRGNVTELIIT